MAELTTTERLQPALLDRLIDDEPGSRLESRDRRVLSMRHLRQAVLRDLQFLLNSSGKPLDDEIHQFPLVARSVVNFGTPDLTGLTASGLRPEDVEAMIADAIGVFEPRIVRRTLKVRAVAAKDSDSSPNVLDFEISGELCPLPMPEALFVKTELDLETGLCTLKERANG